MRPVIFENNHEGREEFLRLAEKAVQWISDYYRDIETYPVRSGIQPGDVYKFFSELPPEEPVSSGEVFDVLNKVILPGITHWQHPDFYAFFPGNTSFPSIIGEIITAGIAAQCMIWESSPAAAELEQRCMEWCRDLLGLPASWAGVIQDTASTATLTSILTAREWKSGFSISEQGFSGKTYRVYASNEAHSSVEKAVRLAGFGTKNLVRVPTNAELSMDPVQLIKLIEKDISDGYIPVCVISTIGTTPTGAVDPVGEISRISRKYELWHHVDAAYAGTALMLDEYAHLRIGLEDVDSFVFNPHKWMFVQFDCTAYYVRDPQLLLRTMSIHPSYLLTSQGNTVNDYRDWGIPLGRRFRALKLWITLQLLGTKAIKERLRHHIRLAGQLVEHLQSDEVFELAYPRNFNIVTFRIKTNIDPDGDRTRKLCSMINDSGSAYMTHATVEGRSLIRWVTGQTYVKDEHVQKTWSQMCEMAKKNYGLMDLPSKKDLEEAKDRISGMVHHTPVMTSRTLDLITDASVFLKCENFQRMGAFKMRGASHALSVLSPKAQSKGVVTHSSGNFAQALALAAKIKQIPSTIVMPKNAPQVKVDAVRNYGGEIVFSGSRPIDREDAVNKIIQDTGMSFIHPSNDLQVILGNATSMIEFAEEVSALDVIIVPVGGGGLLAGTALAAHWYSPETEVWAAEPENADDAFRSLQSGKIETNETANTIADGLRTHLGEVNFPIIKKLVGRIVLVSEMEIVDGMKWIWERMKIIIEPSSAVAIAALLKQKEELRGKRVGIIISGGNVDLMDILDQMKNREGNNL